MQPPAQEIQARDLHDNVWTFRHIYRGNRCSIMDIFLAEKFSIRAIMGIYM
jgi:hypothetical protein